MRRQPRTRWLAGVLYVCAAVLLCPPESSAQFEAIWAPDRASSDGEIALFAHWTGEAENADGLHMNLPSDWSLQRAQAVLPTGVVEPLTVIAGSDRNRVAVAGLPTGRYTLILHVTTGPVTGTETWSFVPFVDDDGAQTTLDRYQVFQYTVLESTVPGTGRRVLSFGREAAELGEPVASGRGLPRRGEGAVLLRNDVLPPLGSDASSTIAFWMQSTGTNEVVLSTWDGNEEVSYPLEITVDAWGQVRYYRGEPGRHQSMVTDRPVADGQWHHIAITHDAESGWTHLLHDGVAVDSLYSNSSMELEFATPLAIGARIDGSEAHRYYTGRLGALNLWPDAHSVEEVRSRKRQPRTATQNPSRDGPVFIDFEDELVESLIDQAPARARRVEGTFSLEEPLRNLRATVEDRGVRIIWDAEGQASEAFVVERSTDGIEFDSLGQLPVTPRSRSESEMTEFTYQDNDVQEQVVYYRVRQRFREGHEHISGSIKLGLGMTEDEDLSALLGNFPNPFQDETIIAFELLQREHVRLSVWDLTGQRVTLLLDESMEPGYHEITFAGYNLPSGTYFVRLETTETHHTHSMILAK